jgi:hypothetical protein
MQAASQALLATAHGQGVDPGQPGQHLPGQGQGQPSGPSPKGKGQSQGIGSPPAGQLPGGHQAPTPGPAAHSDYAPAVNAFQQGAGQHG